ncbi:MAG: TraB/GumN family protein [Candidatus Diapherotrites archaeon]|uniref:TraB/GumN family protein n=1 Tax=Candidatus Iainarchaeum sp. TaxID=3101447 RepID=A0A8T4CAH6_9ARCH|nr:TraB/GumN family protein [Candidatus Diapherotrites archaeon]
MDNYPFLRRLDTHTWMSLFRSKLGEKEIILVGTAHISKTSVELVQKTITEEKPDIVGVELDEIRLQKLMNGEKWENTNVLKLIESGQSGLVLLNLFLSNMQKRLGENVGVKPGDEMKIAVEYAQQTKTPLLLMDRSLQITMKRALSNVSLWEKLKLGGSLVMGLFGDAEQKLDEKKIEEMKQSDLVTKLMEDLSKEYPKLKKTLVDERDAYIAHALIQTPGKKIVGVVGAGHVKGILEHLEKHRTGKKDEIIPLNELNIVPTKKKNKWMEWGIPIVFVAIFIWLFLQGGVESSLHFFAFWFIGHGILAALGALAGGAHWTTVLGVFLTAWFAALHPLIAAGWIAAAMEAKRDAPAMKDFTSLDKLNSLGSFRKNRVTQILLITVLTNLGSMLATILVIPYLVSVLA